MRTRFVTCVWWNLLLKSATVCIWYLIRKDGGWSWRRISLAGQWWGNRPHKCLGWFWCVYWDGSVFQEERSQKKNGQTCLLSWSQRCSGATWDVGVYHRLTNIFFAVWSDVSSSSWNPSRDRSFANTLKPQCEQPPRTNLIESVNQICRLMWCGVQFSCITRMTSNTFLSIFSYS